MPEISDAATKTAATAGNLNDAAATAAVKPQSKSDQFDIMDVVRARASKVNKECPIILPALRETIDNADVTPKSKKPVVKSLAFFPAKSARLEPSTSTVLLAASNAASTPAAVLVLQHHQQQHRLGSPPYQSSLPLGATRSVSTPPAALKPGAIAVQGINAAADASTFGDEEEDITNGQIVDDIPVSNTHHRTNEEGLVEALPVSPDSSTLFCTDEAQQVDVNELGKRQQIRAKRNRFRILGCLLIFVALTMGIAVGAAFGAKNNSNPGAVEASKNPASKPITAPTSFPSSAPTGSLDLLLMDLPDYTLTSLQSSSTPQWKAMQWLSNHNNITQLPEWRKKQLFALATFFHAFEGPKWPDYIQNDGWLDDTENECYWHSSEFGLVQHDGKYWERNDFKTNPCNGNDEIQSLFFANLELSAYSPHVPPEISLLTSLSILALPFNSLHSTLEALLPLEALSFMSNLTFINLQANSILGSIPSEIGLLTSLQSLHFYSNELSGTMPSEIGLLSNIETLRLSVNTISGSIPKELGFLSHMKWLDLSSNQMSGTIPHALGSLSNITDVFFGSNMLFGTMPSELGMLYHIERLNFASNHLSGTIPNQIGSLSNITHLEFLNNGLSGNIPSELGMLHRIERLDLARNQLSGTMPSQLGSMSSIATLSLSSNFLSGTLPTEFGMLLKIQQLRLSSNQLYGSIPSELLLLSKLLQLSLGGGNVLSGTIPTAIGMLSSIEWLDLTSNTLSGTIASELGLLSNVTVLSLRGNVLSGTIPSELGMLSKIYLLDLASNQLTGNTSSVMRLLPNITTLFIDDNLLTGPTTPQ